MQNRKMKQDLMGGVMSLTMIIVVFVAVILALSARYDIFTNIAFACTSVDPWPPIGCNTDNGADDQNEIGAPATNNYYHINEEVACTCSLSHDYDKKTIGGNITYVSDTIKTSGYPNWTCTMGSWKNDNHTSTTVTWISPSSSCTPTIAVKQNDLPADGCADDAEREVDARSVKVLKANVSADVNDIVLGNSFTVTVNTGGVWNGVATITKTGTDYTTFTRTEVYCTNVDTGATATTSAYLHHRGIKLPTPATVTISQGQGSFAVTQYTMEPTTITVTIPGISCAKCGQSFKGSVCFTKEHVWAYVFTTKHDSTVNSESGEHEHEIGAFLNNQPRGALPWGSTYLMESWVVCKTSLSGSGVDVQIRDHGPWYPLGNEDSLYYPVQNDYYNEYWGGGGWPPLASCMISLHRSVRRFQSSEYAINGAGLDLSSGAFNALGITDNCNIYWRLK